MAVGRALGQPSSRSVRTPQMPWCW